jgi:hypothetical protein
LGVSFIVHKSDDGEESISEQKVGKLFSEARNRESTEYRLVGDQFRHDDGVDKEEVVAVRLQAVMVGRIHD